MRPLYLPVLLSFLTTTCFSQLNNGAPDKYPRWQITTGIGLLGMTGLPSGIDQQVSIGAKLDANYNFQISGKHYLTLGIGFETNGHIVDGYFTKDDDHYNFSITPSNYKQHEITLNYLHFPILYKYRWLNTSSVSIGPYAGFLLDSKSKYKIGSAKFDADAPIENEFRWGLQGEWEVFNFYKAKDKSAIVFGMGAQYQISNYLKDVRSFKPLFAYVKLGIAIR